MIDRSEEGGDAACWAHLFDDEDEEPAERRGGEAAPEGETDPRD